MASEIDRAKERASTVMLLDPENCNLMYNLACSMIRLGEVDEPLKSLDPVFKAAQRARRGTRGRATAGEQPKE